MAGLKAHDLRPPELVATVLAMEHKRVNRPKGEGSLYRHTDGRWMYAIMHDGKRLIKSLGNLHADLLQ